MPPRMLPVAIPRLWAADAVTTIAISGRFVAIARRIAPPTASPMPNRFERTSVEFDSRAPASHTTAAATANPRIRSARLSVPRGSEALADAIGDGRHLESRARHVLQELLGGRALPQRPELTQQVACVALREPVVAELAAEELAQLRLERPRTEVAGHVEAAVDVVEVALGVDGQLQRVAEDLEVALPHRRHGVGLEELDLVEQLRRVAAD